MPASSPSTLARWRPRDLFLLAGVAYLLVAVGNLIHQEVRLQHYASDLRTERTTVESERQRLTHQLALYKQDAGVERLARQQLGMARADELPVRFVATPAAPPAAAVPGAASR